MIKLINHDLNFQVITFYCQRHPESLLEGFTHTQVSTLAVKEKLLVVGGFQGELIFKVIWRFAFVFRDVYSCNF